MSTSTATRRSRGSTSNARGRVRAMHRASSFRVTPKTIRRTRRKLILWSVVVCVSIALTAAIFEAAGLQAIGRVLDDLVVIVAKLALAAVFSLLTIAWIVGRLRRLVRAPIRL